MAPIKWLLGVDACADVVADVPRNVLIRSRIRLGGKAFRTEEAIDFAGGFRGEEFAMRIRPAVGRRAGDGEKARGGEFEQFMLVEGGGVFMADILFDVLHKPVRENGMHDEKVFAEKAAREGRAAAAGAVGDDHFEALIGRSGPEGGLAEAGEAVDADLRRVDHRIGFQIVEHAGEAPRPDADGRVVLMAAFEAVDVVEKRQGAAVPCGGGVGKDIVIAGGYGCIAAGDGFAEAPEGLLRGAFVMIGFVFGDEAGAADV